MHAGSFLHDLAVIMISAGLVTVLFRRLHQPVVLGYILAGVIVGPHFTPHPLIQDEATIKTLSELGVILLMFSLGLEFNLRKLSQVGLPAFVAAILEILLMGWVGYELGRLFGWPLMDRVFLGAILCISSTTIIVKALGELGKMRERFAQLIFGILIIEDLLGIALIALLSGVAARGSVTLADAGVTLSRLALFLVVVLVTGLIAVPRLIARVARFRSSEVLLVSVLGICFGFSLLALELGYSVALGAFLAGAVVAEAREIHRVEALVEPVRDMFSAIFFVSIGLLIEPRVVLEHWGSILAITVAVVLGKVLSCSFGAFVGGNDTRTALRVGLGLAQIGEFSFIIASLGLSLKATSPFLYPVAVAVSAITTLLTPYLIRSSDRLASIFDRVAPRSLVTMLGVYTRWAGDLGAPRHKSLAARLVRRWFWQMALNAALMAAVFLSAVYLGQRPPGWLRRLGIGEEATGALLWLAAAVLSMPMFIATFRKLQALGLLVAETRVPVEAAGRNLEGVRGVVAQVIPIGGTVALAVYVLLLSSALVSTLRMLLALVALVALSSYVLWRWFIRVYARAQGALEETLAGTPSPEPASAAPARLPALLSEAHLRSVSLASDSPGVGKMIRELALRTRTGASVVGIGRGDASLINPGPDEELQAGDQVLLLGHAPQLEAAAAFLLSPGT
jgi:CPA2 family monovalent cation:H+ antiporter-2